LSQGKPEEDIRETEAREMLIWKTAQKW